MNGKVQRKSSRQTATARRRQALLVRALVGSLVLCAALAPTNALAQSDGAQQGAFQRNAAPEVKGFRPINSRPLHDLLAKTQSMIKAGELSPQDTFDFNIEADRNADGSLGNVVVTPAHNSNPRWEPLLKEFVAALSESGAISLLQDVDHLTITLKLDERASANLQAVVASDGSAAQMAQNYNALLGLARLQRRGREGVEVLNQMTFSANGKQLLMQLEMSREQVGNLLQKHSSLP